MSKKNFEAEFGQIGLIETDKKGRLTARGTTLLLNRINEMHKDIWEIRKEVKMHHFAIEASNRRLNEDIVYDNKRSLKWAKEMEEELKERMKNEC